MPNNSSTRRDKDKKNKDKKNKDNKKTDTPPLLEEDTASADSNSLSLSVAGKEQTRPESSLILYERALTRPDLLLSLAVMEEHMQKHAKGEEDAGTEQMKDFLLYEHSLATTLDERMDMRKKFTDEIRNANQLVSREELKSLRQ